VWRRLVSWHNLRIVRVDSRKRTILLFAACTTALLVAVTCSFIISTRMTEAAAAAAAEVNVYASAAPIQPRRDAMMCTG
jgi:hypothetical protein